MTLSQARAAAHDEAAAHNRAVIEEYDRAEYEDQMAHLGQAAVADMMAVEIPEVQNATFVRLGIALEQNAQLTVACGVLDRQLQEAHDRIAHLEAQVRR